MSDLEARITFNLVPMRRALAEAYAGLALLVVKDPRRRWKLQYRIARIRRRRGISATTIRPANKSGRHCSHSPPPVQKEVTPMDDSQDNPTITVRLTGDQIESLMQVLDFAASSDPNAALDSPIPDADLNELRDLLEAHQGEHVVFEDEEDE